MARQIVQHRRGTTTEWEQYKSLIPQDGEIVLEMNEEDSSYKLKIGNGTSTYEELDYLNTDAPCTSGEGLPDTAQGSVGGLYLDTLTGNVYKCVREEQEEEQEEEDQEEVQGEKQSVFVWEPVGNHITKRTITIESPFPSVLNCGIKTGDIRSGKENKPDPSRVIGQHIETLFSYVSTGSDYRYRIYPNLSKGTYNVETRCSNSKTYQYYAFLVDAATGEIKDVALQTNEGSSLTNSDTISIEEDGISLYLVQSGSEEDVYTVTQTVSTLFADYVEEVVGNETSMKAGREAVDQLRMDYINLNLSKKLLNFAWITDPHYNDRDKTKVTINNFCLFSELCNEKFVDMGIVGGDLSSSLFSSRKQYINNMSGAQKALGDISIPVYHLRGNHDICAKYMTVANSINKRVVSPDGIVSWGYNADSDGDGLSEWHSWTPDWANQVYFTFGVNPNNGSQLFTPVSEESWNKTDILYIRDETQQIPTHLWSQLCQNHTDAIFDSTNPLGGYFYKDFEQEKIRIIVTNCYDNGDIAGEGLSWGAQQTRFIAQQALNLADKTDWNVILFSHDFPDQETLTAEVTSPERRRLVEVLTAFTKAELFSGTLLDSSEPLEVDYRWNEEDGGTKTKVKLIATIHGHAHADMFDDSYDWNNIGTIAAHNSYGADYIGTIKEFGVSVFTVDTESKVLYETRIGRGNSRAFSFDYTINSV